MSTHDNDDYEIGYGKPPKSSRFRKGQSGNPKGRPKGARGVRASLKKELESKITVREGNREIRMSKAKAMAKRLAASGLKGDNKVLMALLKLDTELYGSVGEESDEGSNPNAPEPVDHDVLRDFYATEPKAQEPGDRMETSEEPETIEDWEIDDWENDDDGA